MIRFYLELGSKLHVRTSVMYRSHEAQVFEYLRIEWRLFRWSGGFDWFQNQMNAALQRAELRDEVAKLRWALAERDKAIQELVAMNEGGAN